MRGSNTLKNSNVRENPIMQIITDYMDFSRIFLPSDALVYSYMNNLKILNDNEINTFEKFELY